MIRDLRYTRDRFRQMSERLRGGVYAETRAPDELQVAGPVGRISWEEAQTLDYTPARLGTELGPLWATYWFRVRANVPDAWAGRCVDLLWISTSEAALWRNGRIVQGLNTGGGGERPDAELARSAEPGPLACEIEVACNGMFGAKAAPARLERCELALVDADAWRLYFDFDVLRALEALDSTDPSWAGLVRSELNRFCNEPDPAILHALYAHKNGTHAHELRAMGHAHIDTAWLWPLGETYRKVARTLASQTRYMDDYPEFRFACSQAQQLAWVEERDPDLWSRVVEKVRVGQLLPVGGTWIEPDCNLPSGESLVRQFLHGQRYFEQRFGRRCNEFWSPDAFGYAGQLPQIMRSACIGRFLTQKLSWNRFNQPAEHTFVWRGTDGSEVLAHFPPADTYNSEATVAEIAHASRAYRSHQHSSTSLMLFGYGDGGGGPTRPMLETLRRAADLQGLPRTHQVTSDEFFAALEREPAPRPVHVGELYFEYHRGTYTTQARIKQLNRRCEQTLHDAELLATARGGTYPRADLDRLWKTLLLNQFHDILPGSSIREVVAEAEAQLAGVLADAEALCGDGQELVNTIGVARREVVDGTVVEAAPFATAQASEPRDVVRVDGLVLENGALRAELAADGRLLSIVHKPTGRETLAAPGNVLELYVDEPVAFDAWDVDPAHLEQRSELPPAERYEVVQATPLRAEIAFDRPGLRQVVRLDAESRRLEFHTEIEWREQHRLLKVCFPLAVHARNATYEMPFGFEERPTHYTTSYDRARYEVPGHRFADLSEHGFGAAVLTDSKYGYSCFGGEVRVSLLRGPTSPDPEADQGRHEFAYALLPHAGGWRESGVLAEAMRFNAPLRRTAGIEPFASIDDSNIALDTIKRAEDSDAIVLRLYEAHGARGRALVRLGIPFSSAERTNLLEDAGEPLEHADGAIVVPYRPHELVTVVVR